MEEPSAAALVVVDAELPHEMMSSSSSSSFRSAASYLRLRRFDETENEPECKQRLLLKQLQGSSCRSLGHENDNACCDEDVGGSASSQHSNTRSKPFWFRRSSSSSSDRSASSRRGVIKRHCSWDEGTITNGSHRLQVLASPSNPRDDETDAVDDNSNSIITPKPVLIGSSKNSVFFSIGGGVRARIQHNHSSRKSTSSHHGTSGIMAVPDTKQIPQQEPAGGHGLDELSWSMEDYDNDHCSIDPDMPLAHVHRGMASSTTTPTMGYQHQKQHQRPPILQCSFGIKAGCDGGAGCPIFPSPSPTDSNVTRSDDDDDDDDLEDEDLRQLSFCPIPLVDESSLAASPHTPPPPPPPSPMMDRWSPSPPLTIKMFGSEPPKLPTRGGGGERRHLAHEEEEELLSCPLSPPKLPTRRPKEAEHEMLLASANPTTSAIPPSPLPLCTIVSRLGGGGECPLSKPIARTAVPLSRGTCSELLCDNGGIIVATSQAKSAATAPSTDPATTVRNIAEEDGEVEDSDDDSVVSPLIGGLMAEYAPASPHQLEYGYRHHGIHNAVLGQRRGILKDNDVVIRGHDKGIRESAFRPGAQPRPQSEESSKKKKRNVTFGRIHIREYERVLGDNPSCSCGPPISLGWMHWDLHDSTLDAYETSQKSHRLASTRPAQRGKRDFYLSPSRRCELILHEWQSGPRVEQVRRLAPQCEDAALLVQYRRRGKSTVESRSKSRLLPTVAALLCKPSVDDSDTSQPTNLHGRRQGRESPMATTTMSKNKSHEQGNNDDDDDDDQAESNIEHDSEV